MRRLLILLSLTCMVAAHAGSSQDEQAFVATLHLGAAPHVRYLDAAGRPLDYAAFAQQLSQGRRHYSITRDTRAGMAVLRMRANRGVSPSAAATSFLPSNCRRYAVTRSGWAISRDAIR